MTSSEMLKMRLEGNTYQQIANKAGVSRQYIQEVLSPPRDVREYVLNKYQGKCDCCGVLVGRSGHIHHRNVNNGENYQDIDNLRLLCVSCHLRQHSGPPKYACKSCGKPIRKGFFCDRICYEKYHQATLTCSYCGKNFTTSICKAQRRLERSKSGLIYCSKKCQGDDIAAKYGFGVFPEHRAYK